ncbi:phospholipase A2 inhibitor and Ly6/PLAUR domain-containing protein-like [Hyla sarda]|uniref:phospholipase A2 inhibitor and Ly6/PLAUR domain-containing protein-like n=1 Tax=Hyla sarda TaxID=327740 RepID=UPI0024C3B07F|nr:phospholipase A2 inhibitor and Ly6/PLAUR domain-containing protein-like [Hyla sarda]
MISVLLSLCVLLVLVTPGYSLKCVECYNITAPQCTGPTKDCDVGICMSGLISLGDYALFGRSCAPNEATCGISGSITSTGRALLSTSCCKTDGCMPDGLKLPSSSVLKNGVTCPTCASSSQNQCNIACTGDEKNCASVELTTLGPGLGTKLQGCATDSVCNFGNLTFDVAGVVMRLGIVCNSASTVVLQNCSFFLTLGFVMFTTKLLL